MDDVRGDVGRAPPGRTTLAGQLASGELGAWCARHLADPRGRDQLLERVRAAVGRRRPLRTVGRPSDPGRRVREAVVARALRQRLAFAVQPAPPYRGLLAAAASGLAGGATVHATAAAFPTHRVLDPARRARALDWRPVPQGWLDLAGPRDPLAPDLDAAATRAPGPVAVAGADRTGRDPHRVAALGERTVELLAAVVPARLGDDRGEADLARACVTFSSWHLDAPVRDPAPPAALGEEVAELAVLARDTGTLTTFHDLAGRPASDRPVGVAVPTVVAGWAEGDLLLTGGGEPGSTLVAVRTADRVADGELVRRWCLELLGSAWLGVRGAPPVERVGLYLGRHGVLVLWETGELAATLAGRGVEGTDGLEALASRWRARCAAVAGGPGRSPVRTNGTLLRTS